MELQSPAPDANIPLTTTNEFARLLYFYELYRRNKLNKTDLEKVSQYL
jgi:hypothetical protein